MKTNDLSKNWLEIAEENVVQSLSNHLNDTKPRIIAGVEIGRETDTKKIESAMKIVEEISSLKNEFNKKNLPLIAVVPKQVFSSILNKLPFYSFTDINERGEVKADVEKYLRKLNRILAPTFFIFCSLGFFALWNFSRFGGNKGGDGILISIFWCIECMFNLMYFIGIFSDVGLPSYFSFKKNTSYIKRAVDIILNTLILPTVFLSILLNKYLVYPFISSKTKKRLLFPKKTSGGEGKVKIQLPSAPEEIKNALIKLSNNGVKVYPIVYEGAFKVSIADEELEYWKRIMDPIFVSESENGKYILVHTFYGNIPQEKRLLKRLQKITSQVTEEYLNSLN